MTNSIGVNPIIIFAAFRYALGRQTYIVTDVTDCIKLNAARIPRADRRQMVREITAAIRNGQAGADMDAEAWQLAAERLMQEDL